MKAEKLPSGKWRARAFNKYTGERPSFTADTKKEAERLARQYEFECTQKKDEMTLDAAMDAYIESREKMNKSVRTVADYKRNKEKHYGCLKPLLLSEITEDKVQKYIDELSVKYAPKTVKNLASLITSTVWKFDRRRLTIELPKIDKPILYLPSEKDIQSLLEACEGTELCSAVYLAVFCALRRGEICALDEKHINGNEIFVEFNMVQDKNNKWVYKVPKTENSIRKITVPDIVIKKIEQYGLPDLNPNELSKAFAKLLKDNNIPHFRLHDCRHFCAARLLSVPLPLVFVKSFGGWASDQVLLQIYNYEIEEIKKKATEQWNSIANNFMNFPQNAHDA